MKILIALSDNVPDIIKQVASHWPALNLQPREVVAPFVNTKFNDTKACFYNAQRYVQSKKDSIYVLGFVLLHGIPIEHAWVKKDDQYIELTLRDDIPHYAMLELDRLEVREAAKQFGDGYIDIYNLNRLEARKKL